MDLREFSLKISAAELACEVRLQLAGVGFHVVLNKSTKAAWGSVTRCVPAP